MQHVKMSKSRGNVVTIDEVVRGVSSLEEGLEFRDLNGDVIDWKIKGVWFLEKQGYFTSTKDPVFLHIINNPIPVLLEPRMDTVQHPEEINFWITLLKGQQ